MVHRTWYVLLVRHWLGQTNRDRPDPINHAIDEREQSHKKEQQNIKITTTKRIKGLHSILHYDTTKLLRLGKESMGTSRVSVAVYVDAERLKMDKKQTTPQEEDESLAALLAKGATQVKKAFDSEKNPHGDASILVSSQAHRMPSFRNLRTLRPSKKENRHRISGRRSDEYR
jgi:hypothetical protein